MDPFRAGVTGKTKSARNFIYTLIKFRADLVFPVTSFEFLATEMESLGYVGVG